MLPGAPDYKKKKELKRFLLEGLRRIRSNRGFTLPELIIIIVLVGIVATIAGFKYRPYAANANLRTAIDQIAADLRFLQCRTMATLNFTGGTYTNTASFQVGANTYLLGGDVKTLPSGVTVQNGLAVTFNSLGEYNTTTDGALTLISRGLTNSIKIYAVSGDVEAY